MHCAGICGGKGTKNIVHHVPLRKCTAMGQPIFGPKNIKFWLHISQILSLSWPMNFLCCVAVHF